MKKFMIISIAVSLFFAFGWIANSFYQSTRLTPNPIAPVIPKPLERYTIENLAKVKAQPGVLKIEETLKEAGNFTSYLFSFRFDPSFTGKEEKITTGQINLPKANGPHPIVIMLRGYVDQEIYKTGVGTRKTASVLAKNGFITLAPDFLGYAGSDSQAEDIFEARFQTYTTILSLLESLQSIKEWDGINIMFWGHSNGGQIALVILEITGEDYPTTLWAPVSKPFPYSILYYTDESEDKGKYIRRHLSRFENLYDVELYSADNYFERITAPLQIHQGTADDAIPLDWSNELAERLKDLEIDIAYYKYPGADHNMVPAWNTVVGRDLSFFQKHLKEY